MAGGVKGLRALRVQRDLINQQIATAPDAKEEQEQMEAGKDRFAYYNKK